MLIRLADRLTRRAKRTGSIRMLKAAWFVRAIASWLRGGDWRSFSAISVSAERAHRRSSPRVDLGMVL
jgi:hypothetical protein